MSFILYCFFLFYRDMIVIGCEDKCVRVYYVVVSIDLFLKIFFGKDYVFLKDERKYKL